MTISRIDDSQRTAARVAGFAYLITFATVVYVNFGIHDRLIVENNAAETARNILAHERLFRIGIVGDLIYCTGVVVLLTALYVILKPVNWGLALLAAFWRLVWALMWLVMTLNLFEVLRLPVVQVPLCPSSTGCLRRDLVRILRGVYFRFLHLSQLRQDR